MKKLLALLLALCLVVSLAFAFTACDDGDGGGDNTSDGGNNDGSGDGTGGGAADGPIDAGNGLIGDGTYYHETRDGAQVIIDGTTLKSVIKYDESGSYALVYTYAVNDAKDSIVLTPVRAELVSDNPSADLVAAVDRMNSTIPTTAQNCEFAFVEGGIEVEGTKYYRTKPDYSQGGPSDGPGGEVSGALLSDGKYYDSEYEDLYMVIEGRYIYMAEEIDNSVWIAYQFEYTIDGSSLNVSFVDIVVLEGALSVEMENELAEEREDMQDYTDTIPYSPIEDGYHIGGTDYVRTKPNYDEPGQGGSTVSELPEGTYYHETQSIVYMVVKGKYLEQYTKFNSETSMLVVSLYEIKGDVLLVTPLRAECVGVPNDTVINAADSFNANIPGPETVEFNVTTDGIELAGLMFYSEMPDYGNQPGPGPNPDPGPGEPGGAELEIPAGIYTNPDNGYSFAVLDDGTFLDIRYFEGNRYALAYSSTINGNTLVREYEAIYSDIEAYGKFFDKLFDEEEYAFKRVECEIIVDESGFELSLGGYFEYVGEFTDFFSVRFDNGIGGYFESEFTFEDGSYFAENGSAFHVSNGLIYIPRDYDGETYYERYTHKVKDGVIHLRYDGAFTSGDISGALQEYVDSINSDYLREVTSFTFSIEGEHVFKVDDVSYAYVSASNVAFLEAGQYWCTEEEMYILADGQKFIFVENYGGCWIAYEYVHFLEEGRICTIFKDLYVLEGEPSPEFAEELDEMRLEMRGYVEFVTYEVIDDGYVFGELTYVKTKPDYDEGGGSAEEGLLPQGTFYPEGVDAGYVVIEGDRIMMYDKYSDDCYMVLVFEYEIVSDTVAIFNAVEATYEGTPDANLLANIERMNAALPYSDEYHYSIIDGGINIEGQDYYPEKSGGTTVDTLEDGIYYDVEYPEELWIVVEGDKLTEVTHYVGAGYIYATYRFNINDGMMTVTADEVTYEIENSDFEEEILEIVEMLEEHFASFGQQTHAIELYEDGFSLGGSEYTKNPSVVPSIPEPTGEYLPGGIYYHSEYDSVYFVVEGECISLCQRRNDEWYIVRYMHYVADGVVVMEFHDAEAMQDPASQDLLDFIEEMTSWYVAEGYIEITDYRIVEDGIVLDDELYVTERPDYEGGSAATGTLEDLYGAWYSSEEGQYVVINDDGTLMMTMEDGSYLTYTYEAGDGTLYLTPTDDYHFTEEHKAYIEEVTSMSFDVYIQFVLSQSDMPFGYEFNDDGAILGGLQYEKLF